MLRSWLERQVLPEFLGRTLFVDTAVAQRCARLHVPNKRDERDALSRQPLLCMGWRWSHATSPILSPLECSSSIPGRDRRDRGKKCIASSQRPPQFLLGFTLLQPRLSRFSLVRRRCVLSRLHPANLCCAATWCVMCYTFTVFAAPQVRLLSVEAAATCFGTWLLTNYCRACGTGFYAPFTTSFPTCAQAHSRD